MPKFAFAFAVVSAVALGAVPAFAQTGASQSPPAVNSNSGGPQPAGSLPAGAANTSATSNVSGGTTTVTTPTTTTTTGPGAAMSTTVPVAK